MDKNDVLLIYPRVNRQKVQKPEPPSSILAVAAPLEQAGYDITILDGRIIDDYEKAISEIEREPICVGISCMIGYQIRDGLKLARLVRKRFPKIPIVWGGWFPTMSPELTISDPHVDIVVRGLGESTFLELVTGIKHNTDLSQVKGITYRKNGQIISNDDRPLPDINNLPPIPYHLLDIPKYSISEGHIRYFASRGCPYRCAFCCIRSVFNRKWLSLNPERVIADLQTLISKYPIRTVFFGDSSFFVSKERVRAICEGIIESNLQIEWMAMGRVEHIVRSDPDLLRTIKESGCIEIFLGGESASQSMLDLLSKDLKADNILRAADLLTSHEIPAMVSFMVGLPGESRDGFRKTLELMGELDKKGCRIDLYYYTPVPGSPLYFRELEEGKLRQYDSLEEWANYVPMDVTRPWLFRNDKHVYISRGDKRKIFRTMSFYFHLASKSRSLLRETEIGRLKKAIYRLSHRISSFRLKRDFFVFPIELILFRLRHRMRSKPGLLS